MGVPHDNTESRSQQRTTEAPPFRTCPHKYVQDLHSRHVYHTQESDPQRSSQMIDPFEKNYLKGLNPEF